MQQKILNNRYELEQKVGEGGMARVYRGRDLRLNRRVAIKVLHSHYAPDIGFLRRFHHEAQAAASLHHPNIVDVYDVGQDGDIHYIVMEYLDGSDLKQLIMDGPMPVNQAVAIAADIADGLDAAHRFGMVHRDVKPQNIIVVPGGRVKITDFGIAKSSLSTATTDTGMTFGTADYISPEQARGLPATAQSDIYALGITLYEMLTGRLPFTGESSVAVATQHVNAEPPPLRTFVPRIPPQLEQLVLRALSKNPAERPTTGREFAQLLNTYRAAGVQDTVLRPVVMQPAARQSVPQSAPGANGRPVLPARPRVSRPTPPRRGIDIGGFLLGILLMGVILSGVYLFESGALNDYIGRTAAPAPAVIRPTDTPTTPTDTPVAPTPTNGAPVTMVVAPNLLNMQRPTAISTIQGLGLFPQEDAPRNSDVVSPGLVLDQFPRPGAMVTTTSVMTYALSLGPAAVPVPEVATMRAADAQFQLRQLGFVVTLREEPSQTVGAGFVARMDPRPPARLKQGETVTIYVSIGDKVRMPEVTGLLEEEARRRISQAGLFVSFIDYQSCEKLGELCNRFDAGTVVSSTVTGGDLVDRNTPVTLGVRQP